MKFTTPLSPSKIEGEIFCVYIFSHSVLMIFGLTFIHLSDGLSGIVTIPLISNLLLLFNFCKKGIPIGAEEKNTTLYLCGSYIFSLDHTQEKTLSTTLGSPDRNQYLLNDSMLYLLQCGS
jgi:hypothetical protein